MGVNVARERSAVTGDRILERYAALELLRKGGANKSFVGEGEARFHEAMADHAAVMADITSISEHRRSWKAEEGSLRVYATYCRRGNKPLFDSTIGREDQDRT